MAVLISVDIGGTSIRATSYPLIGQEPVRHFKTSTTSPGETVYDRVCQSIRQVLPPGTEIKAIGVATAGPLDPRSGFIFDAPNIPGWKDFPLGERLRHEFNVPVVVENDANMAAFGEWKFGAGVGLHDLLYLTISTGIGAGVISSDLLIRGYRGLGAELGHVTLIPDGPLCSCGKRGHLEAISSGPAIVSYYLQLLKEKGQPTGPANVHFSTREVALAAQSGDPLALQAFQHAGSHLGLALAGFIHIFNPAMIVLGGGVSQSGPLLTDPMMERMRAEVMEPIYLKDLQILPSKLGDDAGLMGVLAFTRQSLD